MLFYEQLVYKQLGVRLQIAKQLLGPNPLSLCNNENYGLKTSGVFHLQWTILAVQAAIHQNSAVSKALLRKF